MCNTPGAYHVQSVCHVVRRDSSAIKVDRIEIALVLKWLPYQAPSVIGSALGLVGPVSVHCGWVR